MKIQGISKTYNIKNTRAIIALNDVSFDLPEVGMIFILGKSGSGKSTLLNVLSGLDKVDKGHIEICGKDITKLSENELCNYRNSCCGFVFQEYNLIPELSVGENIMLALQLQGEKNAESKVREILERVGLSEYEKRKVTELSGGQKQRVAIARAIVKNPNIIFADEPTGALDEQTGKSILNLLKEFSKNKLVIVVTHDKEFAKKYGDRVIELADGKIVSDSDETKFIQEGTDTETWKKPKLPIKIAFKIGCSNFKYHPIRLLATIFLSIIAFTFLGISLNISFSRFQDIVFNSMKGRQIEYSLIKKYDKNNLEIPIKENEKHAIEKDTGRTIGAMNMPLDIKLTQESENSYYSTLPNGYAEISDDLIKRFNLSVIGQLPHISNEIALTKLSAEIINYRNYFENSDEKIIGNYLEINGREYIITAIIDTHFDADKYSILKNALPNTESRLEDSFQKELMNSLHNFIFVNDITDYCTKNILTDKETCRLYLTDEFSIEVTQLTPNADLFDIYSPSNCLNGNYISAYLIPVVLQTVDCNIKYDNRVFLNYGDLFRALYDDEYSNENAKTDDSLYIGIYEKYKNKYLFPTSFDCFILEKKYNIKCGVSIDGFYVNGKNDGTIILSDELYQTFYDEIGGRYNYLFISAENNAIKQYIRQKGTFRIDNFIVENITKYWSIIDTIKDAAYILSGIFAIFSISLFLNFMSQSVIDKTKIIGILKAGGCNNHVLNTIFIVEGIIVACSVFTIVTLMVLTVYMIFNKYYANIVFLGINIRTFPVLASFILLFALSGCLFPIIHIKNRSPYDIISRS